MFYAQLKSSYLSFFLLIPLISISGCARFEIDDDWGLDEISDIQGQPISNPPSNPASGQLLNSDYEMDEIISTFTVDQGRFGRSDQGDHIDLQGGLYFDHEDQGSSVFNDVDASVDLNDDAINDYAVASPPSPPSPPPQTWQPGDSCNDLNPCTYNDQYTQQGQCRGTPITCNSDICITRECNGTASCTESPRTGQSCNDGDLCTYNDRCTGQGQCEGSSITCNSDTCITRECNGTSSCEESPRTGQACNDGNLCTYNDRCTAQGQCEGSSITCSSETCINRECNGTSSCEESPRTGQSCNDGNLCTYNDRCTAQGQCEGTSITCSSDTCNTRTCNGTHQCTVSANMGVACGDSGSSCTRLQCNANGACVESNVPNATTCEGTLGNICCSGQCVPSLYDIANCGGCGIRCRRGLICMPSGTDSARCSPVPNIP